MKNQTLSFAETAALIEAGEILAVAGPEAVLAGLPRGKWIGGSTAYAVAETGGTRLEDSLYVTHFPEALGAVLRLVPTDALSTLAAGYLPGGVTLALIPGFSAAHSEFAVNAAGYAGIFDQPLMGWITGVALDEIGRVAPIALNGMTGERVTDGVLLMHLALPENTTTELDIVNPFTPSDDPATTFSFPQSGFTVSEAVVGGQTVNLAAYVAERGIDTRLPLIADYAGALINVSVRSIDDKAGTVTFYAPVMAGAVYRLAQPLEDHAAAFSGQGGRDSYACHCILNYVYGALEGKRTGAFTGPVSFGEIAYILLNQTMVRLDIHTA